MTQKAVFNMIFFNPSNVARKQVDTGKLLATGDSMSKLKEDYPQAACNHADTQISANCDLPRDLKF
jgi:hypothetical protein